MKTTRYSEPQILAILRQAEGGVPVAELCRGHGMSNASFYKWRAKYGGMDASMVSQMNAVARRGARIALACRAFGVSETCYRYGPKLRAETEETADLLTGLRNARKTWGSLNRPVFAGDQLVRFTRPYRVYSSLHRMPPLLRPVGCFRWAQAAGGC